MVTVHKVEQGTDEWHELRAPLYTASEAGKLLTKGKFKKEPSNFKGNFYTERGHLLEVEALQLYHQIKGSQSLPHGFISNSKYPLSGASPDDLTIERYVEVKCFNQDRHRACAKELFFEVIAQVQYGLMITEYKVADVVLYNPKLPADEALIIIEVRADKMIHDNFRRILA